MKLIKLFVIIILVLLVISGCSEDTNHTLNLTFKKVEMKSEITKISELAIDKIISKVLINDALVFLYRPKIEAEQINGGIKIKDDYYDLGPVSIYQLDNEIELKDLFGKKVVKLSGSLGANYSQAMYILIEDSKPGILLQVDGNVIENDVDRDNEKEVVSTWGTLANTKIYKNIGNIVMVSDVNDSTNAQVVLYINDSNIFEIYQKQDEPRFYVLFGEVLKEVEKP